jgi:hypothetical protein
VTDSPDGAPSDAPTFGGAAGTDPASSMDPGVAMDPGAVFGSSASDEGATVDLTTPDPEEESYQPEPTEPEDVVPEMVPGVVPVGPVAHREATVRTAPRYRAFILSGVLVGIVVAVVLIGVFPDDGRFSTGSVFGYLAVSLALIGGILGALAAVLIDRRS